jgi:hypothetical protein
MAEERKARTSRTPIILLIVGGLLLLVAALIWASTSRGGGGTPAISVDPTVIDSGEMKLGTETSFSLQVTNTGDGVLRFQEKPYIEVLEGC